MYYFFYQSSNINIFCSELISLIIKISFQLLFLGHTSVANGISEITKILITRLSYCYYLLFNLAKQTNNNKQLEWLQSDLSQ